MSGGTSNASNDYTHQISQQFLLRIIQQHIEDEKTRVSQPALNALGEYIKTFIKEAIWRAAAQRKDPNILNKMDTQGGSQFLEVEDLEKLAPQLLLDF